MTNKLHTWATRHNIPPAALQDLIRMFTAAQTDPEPHARLTSEAAAQDNVWLEASKAGVRLWRNNVGAGKLDNGSFIRWGLANDTKQMNEYIKSSDLIGIRPVTVTPAHVGTVIGQFVAREVKAPGWRYSGSKREEAQRRWLELIAGLGGDAEFTTGAFV